MRMIPVRLSARGKAVDKKQLSAQKTKTIPPGKTGELIGMDAIELRMGTYAAISLP